MVEQEEIYRKTALDRLSSPEDLDQLLQIIRLRSWLILLALGLLVAAASSWVVLGKIPVTVNGEGLILPPSGISDIRAPKAGWLQEVLVREGQRVERGEPIARIRLSGPVEASTRATEDSPAAGTATVFAPEGALVVELLAAAGQQVQTGTPLCSLASASEGTLGVLFLRPTEGRRVRPGMPVQIRPAGAEATSGDRWLGQVIRVAPFPSSVRGLESLLAEPTVAQELVRRDLRMRVDVRLRANRSSSSGPGAAETSGPASSPMMRTRIRGTVTLGDRRPIDFVVPWLAAHGEG